MSTLSPEQQLQLAQQRLNSDIAAPGIYGAGPPSYASMVEQRASGISTGLVNVAQSGTQLATTVGMMRMGFDPFNAFISTATPDPTGASYFAPGDRWFGNVGQRINNRRDQRIREVLAGRGISGPLRPDQFIDDARALAGGHVDDVNRLVRGARWSRMGAGAALAVGTGGVGWAAQEALMFAGTRTIEGMQDFVATRELMRSLPTQHAPFGGQSIFARPNGSTLAGPAQITQMQGVFNSLAGQYGSTSGQMRNAASMLGQQGMLDTRSVDTVSRSLRESMSELSRIASRINGDLEEATRVYSTLRGMGFDSRVSRARALTMQQTLSGLTGLSTEQVARFQTDSMRMATEMGLTSQTGLRMGSQSLATSSMRVAQGLVSNQYMQMLGVQGGTAQERAMALAQRMQEIEMGMVHSEGGQVMMSNLFSNAGTFGINRNAREVLAGGEVRYNRDFGRNFDPYAMAGMQDRMAGGLQAGIVLNRIDAIRRENEDPLERNRAQYEFLSSLGISDPTEQLEYLSQLQNRGRAQSMMTIQELQNRFTATAPTSRSGGVSDPGLWQGFEDKVSRAMDRVFGNLGANLERFGGALNVVVERMVESVTNAYSGRQLSFASGMVDTASLERTNARYLQGDYRAIAAPDLRGILGRDSVRAGLSTNATITGNPLGGLNSLFRTGGGRGSMARSYSSLVNFGLVETSEDLSTGIYMGLDRRGRGRVATADQLLQALALDMGGMYDVESGRLLSATDAGMQDVARRVDMTALERSTVEMARPDQVRNYMEGNQRGTEDASGRRRRDRRGNAYYNVVGMMRGWSDRVLGTSQMDMELSDRDIQLARESGVGTQQLNVIAQQYRQRDWAQLTTQERANVLGSVQQSNSALTRILGIEDVDFSGQGMTTEQFQSMVVSMANQSAVRTDMAGALGMGGGPAMVDVSGFGTTGSTLDPSNVQRNADRRLLRQALGGTLGPVTAQDLEGALGRMGDRQGRRIRRLLEEQGLMPRGGGQNEELLSLMTGIGEDMSGDFDATRTRGALAVTRGMALQMTGGDIFAEAFDTQMEQDMALRGYVQSRRMELSQGGSLGANDTQIREELAQQIRTRRPDASPEDVSLEVDRYMSTEGLRGDSLMRQMREAIRTGGAGGVLESARRGETAVEEVENSAYRTFMSSQLTRNRTVLREARAESALSAFSALSSMGFGGVGAALGEGGLEGALGRMANGTLDADTFFNQINPEELESLRGRVRERLGSTTDEDERARLTEILSRLGEVENLSSEDVFEGMYGLSQQVIDSGGQLDTGMIASLMEAEVTGANELAQLAQLQADVGSGRASSDQRQQARDLLRQRGINLEEEARNTNFESVDAFLEDVLQGGSQSRPAMQQAIERILTSADFQSADVKRREDMDRLMRQMAENLAGIHQSALGSGGLNVNVVQFTANLQLGVPADGTSTTPET